MAVSAGRAPTPWAMRAWALIVRWRRWIWLVIGVAGLLLAARAVAGSLKGMIVFALPGSPAAARLALERLILPELGHAVRELTR